MALNSSTPESSGQLYVGTSGYSFPEWVEADFYPPDTPQKDMLTLYAERFKAVEINYTWYQMPRAEAMARNQFLQYPQRSY